MRTRFAAALAFLLIVTPSYGQELSFSDFLEVGGEVRTPTSTPIENARVIAFSLSDALSLRTSSTRSGAFTLPPLPVGVYRVVAVKRGYLPALVTVIPTKKDHRIVLELVSQELASDARKEDAWTIRRSLPMDVLREVEFLLGGHDDAPGAERIARFAGQMESVNGYSGETSERALERTSLRLVSDLGQWGVEFRGTRHLVDQSASVESSTTPAESADMVLQVRSSASNSYRIASTRASWQPTLASGPEAGIETHSLAWEGGRSAVQVRYQSHENLFSGPGPESENTIELAGSVLVHRGRRSDLGVSVRLTQDMATGGGIDETAATRYADFATNGRWALGESFGVEYGLVTRVGAETLQFTPQSSAEFRIGDRASVKIAGAYKFDTSPQIAPPMSGIGHLGRLPTLNTRYRYSITVATDVGDHAGISAGARRAAADALTFVLLDDRFDEFWDGLYLQKGDVLTDGILSIRVGIGPAFEIAVATSAGQVQASEIGFGGKEYVSGEIRTHYEPTGTTLDVSYRLLEQPDLVDSSLLREIERLSVVLGQSLHLPVDVRLLLGFSVGSEAEIVASTMDAGSTQTRLVGGVSFSF